MAKKTFHDSQLKKDYYAEIIITYANKAVHHHFLELKQSDSI